MPVADGVFSDGRFRSDSFSHGLPFARMTLLPLTVVNSEMDMHKAICSIALILTVWYSPAAVSQNRPRTLVAVWAHPDDEVPVGPVLAR